MSARRAWPVGQSPEGGILGFTVLLWLGFFVLVVAVTGIVAIVGDVRSSGWEQATQLPRPFAFAIGLWLTGANLRVYVAHGQTRRDFMRQASVFVVVFAALLAALTTVGYLLELALYRIAGWPQTLSPEYLFDSAGQVGPILLTYLLVYLVWTVVGALGSACFYRLSWYGLVIAVPCGLLLVTAVEMAVGSWSMPLLAIADLEPASSVLLALVVGIGGSAAGLAATWTLVREMPLHAEAV